MQPVPLTDTAQHSLNLVACRGCGCKGGPGWRVHRTGKCASNRNLSKECGNPPSAALCTFENAGRTGITGSSNTATVLLSSPGNVQPSNQMMSGTASIIDGDTIEIHGQRIRLFGIDAPEGGQTCFQKNGNEYRCGQISANALDEHVQASQPVTCQRKDIDRYERMVAVCKRADGKDIAAWLVLNGHALDWPKYSSGLYLREQSIAKKGSVGIWQGKFVLPWEWRTGR